MKTTVMLVTLTMTLILLFTSCDSDDPKPAEKKRYGAGGNTGRGDK